MLLFTGGEFDIHGPLPQPPFYLASNHLSYVDIWVLFAALRATFIAKHDLKSWPIMGYAMKLTGIIFINRNKKMDVSRVNQMISKELHSPRGIIVFPEGTTALGSELKPYNSPLLEIPASQQFPVHSVLLYYEDKVEGGKSLHGSSFIHGGTKLLLHHFYPLTRKGYIARLSFSIKYGVQIKKKLTEFIFQWSQVEYENLKRCPLKKFLFSQSLLFVFVN